MNDSSAGESPNDAELSVAGVKREATLVDTAGRLEPAGTARWSGVAVRLGIAGVVLLLEYLGISYTFDAHTVSQRGGVWSVLGQVGRLGPLLVVAATAVLLLPSATREMRVQVARPPSLVILLLHALLAAAFVYVTQLGFGSLEAPPGPAMAWMLGWAVLGAATAMSLFVGALGEWRGLLKSLGRAAAAGGILGLFGWVAGSLSTELWAPLSRATFHTVALLLHAMGFELEVDPTDYVLSLEGFAVSVAPVCSGFEGIGLYFALMVGFLYHFRATLRFPNALLLLPVGMALVWFGNALRIASLMIVGARVDAEMAIGSFHSKAGWVFFCAITLAIAALARSVPFLTKRTEDDARDQFENPTAPYLLPVLTWIGVGLFTSMFSSGHDPLYAVRVGVTAWVLWAYRAHYAEIWRKPSALAWLLGAAVGVVWLVLPSPATPDVAELPAPGQGWSSLHFGSWLVFRVVGAVLIVPLCEELAFRGYLARFVSNREFWLVPYQRLTLVGILGSSLAFGLVHDRLLLAVGTGVVYALLLKRQGRLVEVVAAHAASNLVIAAWVLATGEWRHW